MQTITMKNCVINERKDGKVEIIFDPAVHIGVSGTGASNMIATTSGNLKVSDHKSGEFSIGLNVYRKK